MATTCNIIQAHDAWSKTPLEHARGLWMKDQVIATWDSPIDPEYGFIVVRGDLAPKLMGLVQAWIDTREAAATPS